MSPSWLEGLRSCLPSQLSPLPAIGTLPLWPLLQNDDVDRVSLETWERLEIVAELQRMQHHAGQTAHVVFQLVCVLRGVEMASKQEETR